MQSPNGDARNIQVPRTALAACIAIAVAAATCATMQGPVLASIIAAVGVVLVASISGVVGGVLTAWFVYAAAYAFNGGTALETLHPASPASIVVLTLIGAAIGRAADVQRAYNQLAGEIRDKDELFTQALRNRDAFVKTALDCIIVLDMQGRIREFNPAAVRTLGYKRNDVLGRFLADVLVPATSLTAQERLSRYLAQGEGTAVGSRIETSAVRANGEEFPAELAITILDERDAAFMVHLRDITERRDNDARLRAAIAAAEEANHAKSDFLATMSHEVRTPMNGVIGMTNLLLESGLDDEQQEFAETIYGSATALLTILNDILDFSKIEAGALQLEAFDFDLITTLEDVLDLFSERADRLGIELVRFVEGSVPPAVRGDQGRLRQILTNLVGNAVKFTEHGAVTVHLSTKSVDDSVVASFEVRDTGIGMLPDDIKRLFRPFSQADSSMSRKFGGTGLGLAISRRLCEVMGGSIGVESTYNKGSRFHFNITLQTADEPVAPFDASTFTGCNVLVVDHHELAARALTADLEAFGMNVERTDRIANRTRTRTPDVAFIALTAESGESAKVLADTLAPVPCIVVASNARRQHARPVAAQIGHGYVTKPFRRRALLRTLARALGDTTHDSPSNLSLDASDTEQGSDAPHTVLRVLVAEDNSVNQRVAKRMVERLNHRCDVVANGREAVEATSRFPYDIVLMDCQMPEVDGFRATQEIREREQRGNTRLPIIAMTANAMKGDREKCINAGMDDYLAKPIDPRELRRALVRWSPADPDDEIKS